LAGYATRCGSTTRHARKSCASSSEALERSGGPFLFGQFSIADCMYYPMRTRFRTYGVAIPDALAPYARALDAYPAVQALERVGHKAPRIEAYDEYLRSVGGDPNAA
jgi:glutathione S-transferase